jgi:AcrR family transcriptional regulator
MGKKTKEVALQTRESVLKAAASVIAQHGIRAFTLDSVAGEASVSKGAVLHHFPSKETLIEGLIEQANATFNDRLKQELDREPPGKPGRSLRAYIRASFDTQFDDQNLISAIGLAFAENNQLMTQIRASLFETNALAVNDGLDPVRGTLIRLAVDGVVFADVLNLAPLTEPMRTQIFDALIRMTEQ